MISEHLIEFLLTHVQMYFIVTILGLIWFVFVTLDIKSFALDRTHWGTRPNEIFPTRASLWIESHHDATHCLCSSLDQEEDLFGVYPGWVCDGADPITACNHKIVVSLFHESKYSEKLKDASFPEELVQIANDRGSVFVGVHHHSCVNCPNWGIDMQTMTSQRGLDVPAIVITSPGFDEVQSLRQCSVHVPSFF
jgi:hypothetical protein